MPDLRFFRLFFRQVIMPREQDVVLFVRAGRGQGQPVNPRSRRGGKRFSVDAAFPVRNNRQGQNRFVVLRFERVGQDRTAQIVPIRNGREPVVFDRSEPYEFGKLHVVREYGEDAVLFASGFLMNRAIAAADQLAQEGIKVTMCDVHTLKPLDTAHTSELLSRCGAAVTVEDHNIIGGLGSAIAETAASYCPTPVERVGLLDIFPSSGEAEALTDYYGMSVENIKAAVRKAVSRK